MLPQLYHAHQNRYLDDLPFWLGLASQAGSPVLELGCGTGRVLIPLAEAGFRVYGLDNDLSMLRFLQGACSADKIPAPALISADISSFRLAIQFPLIILPCNTYSTLAEDARISALNCIVDHLKPGGLFATSLPNPELLTSLPANSKLELEDEFILPQSENPVQVSSAWQRTKEAFNVTWCYDHLLPDGKVERTSYTLSHSLASTDAYIQEMQAAGRRVVGTYGDSDRSEHTPDSPQLILLASS